MPWFTDDAVAFFKELEDNNNKEWFEKNKKRYESAIKKPMLEFAAEMIERMRALDPEITMLPKNAVFRIHRDTRFSKDKSPYKTNAGLVVTRGEKHNPGVPGLYFHIDANMMGVASGLYFVEPAQLKSVREHIASNNEEFEKLLNDKEFRKHFPEGIVGEKNKILPPELKEAAVKQPLIFNKQFYYWAELDPKQITRDDLPDFVMFHIKAAWPMNQFLRRPLGF